NVADGGTRELPHGVLALRRGAEPPPDEDHRRGEGGQDRRGGGRGVTGSRLRWSCRGCRASSPYPSARLRRPSPSRIRIGPPFPRDRLRPLSRSCPCRGSGSPPPEAVLRPPCLSVPPPPPL